MPFDCISYHPQDEILRVLSAAQERIRKPENWVARSRAIGWDGNHLNDGSNPRAVRWCALGAIDWAVGKSTLFGHAAIQSLAKAAREMNYGHPAECNWSGYDNCHVMFSRAIELRLADMAKEAVHVA